VDGQAPDAHLRPAVPVLSGRIPAQHVGRNRNVQGWYRARDFRTAETPCPCGRTSIAGGGGVRLFGDGKTALKVALGGTWPRPGAALTAGQ